MPGPLTVMQPRADAPIMRPRAPGEASPPPSWFEAAGASWRLGQDDEQDYQMLYQAEAYKGLEDELVRMGYPKSRYHNPDWNSFLHPDGWDKRKGQIWADVEEMRRRDPRAFGTIPADQAGFETWAARRKGARDRDEATAARGGTGSALLPGLAFGLLRMGEPENLVQIPMGGGARTTAGMLASQFGAGVAGTVLTTPGRAQARAQMGESYSGDQLAGDAVVGGLANAGLVGLHLGAGKAGSLAYDRLPLDWRLAQQLKREVPAALRTPEQQAAIHVIERGAEVDATSPYVASAENLDAHSARLQQAMEALDSMPRAAAPALRPEPAPVPAAPRQANGSIGYSKQVYDGLIARGVPEHTARGVAAGIHAESRSDPTVMGGYKGRAQGIGQWLGTRRAELRRRYGNSPTLDQQLDFLVWELRGGDPGGKAVLSARDEATALHSYINDFMRPAKGAETSGDLQRGMAALGRGGEDIPVSATGPDLATALPLRPEAMDAVRPPVTTAGRQVPIETFRPDDIGVDAALMQFKSGGDEFGVTDRLRGVQSWDPISAGTVTVWEAANGRRLIADGHQRLGLARRLQANDPSLDIQLPAFVLREADGFSASDARLVTALKNLREGSGSATDAAKVLREAGLDEAVLNSLPQRGREGAVVRDGRAIARLSNEAFGAVVNEVIPEGHAAAIGALAPDPATHMALVELLARLEPANRHQAESVVRQALDAGFATEHQNELFGTREVTNALFIERAKVLDRTLGELRKLKGAFGVAARNAEALDAAGNRIDVGASEAAQAANARALAIVDQLALRKGNAVNAIITGAAERLAAGEPLARILRDTVAELRGLDLDGALRDAGGAGRPAGGAGPDQRAAGEDAQLSAEPGPAELDELEAAGQGGFVFADDAAHQAFDDPAGAGIKAASESLWHDIRASEAQAAETRLAAQVAEVHARALANQVSLVELGTQLKGKGVEFVDPGVKSPERIAEKVRLEGYASPAELADTARAAFVVRDPAQAAELVQAIADRFPGTVDKGWKQLGSSYLDRKLVVMFGDGSRGELQIVPAPVWKAKKAGGNELYKAERVESDPEIRAGLLARAQQLYDAALAGTPFEGIAARSAEGKRAANSSVESASPSSADLTNSPGASRQVPFDQAQARPGLTEASTATGRSSTSNNSSFTEGPPSGDGAAPSTIGGESQDAAALFDLGDGRGERTIAEIEAELDAEDAAIAAMRSCLK